MEITKIDAGNQLQMWVHLTEGQTLDAAVARNDMDTAFETMFPGSHDYDLRSFVCCYAARLRSGHYQFTKWDSGLRCFHPEAMKLLSKYGQNMTPCSFRGKQPHQSGLQPKPHACFDNAINSIKYHRHITNRKIRRYVEGVAAGPIIAPILHAWNSDADGSAHDWTLYANTDWVRYFGIAFTLEEYNFIMTSTNPDEPVIQSLFGLETFDQTRGPIGEILSDRTTL